MAVGLLLGGLGAVLVLYMPEAMKPTRDEISPPAPPKAGSVAKKPGPSKLPAPYAENQRMEGLVNRLDQTIFATFRGLDVPDQDVNVLKVDNLRQGDLEWDHAVVEADLPPGVPAAVALDTMRIALGKLDLNPKIRINSKRNEGRPTLEVQLGEYRTHTIHFIAAATPPTKNASPVETPPTPRTTELETPATKPPAHDTKASSPSPTEIAPRAAPAPANAPRPKVAIVIDDCGLNLDQAKCFLDLNLPLTMAVLPFLPASEEVARQAHRHGRAVILHMPMQPLLSPEKDPGPGGLFTNMGRTEIQDRIRAALANVPYAVGINNHMGSLFTEDRVRMDWVLEVLRERELFFLDSRTSMRSVALDRARQMGVPAGQRAIFLDNIQEPQAIQIQLKKLVGDARRSGMSVGIGHVHPVTCQTLKSELNYLNSKVDLVSLPTVIR